MNDTYFFGKRMSFNEGGRARFNVGGTGNKDAEAQGLDYISNNKYLQDDFTGSTPLDFSNVSNSGIMTQAPVPGPLKYIPDGGGGGDDDDGPPGPPGTKGPSGITGYDSLGNPISKDMSIGSVAKNAFGFLTNPLGFLGMKAYRAYKDKKAKQELQDFYNTTEAKTAQDMARDNKAGNTGGYQAGYGGDFMDGPSGAGRGNAPSDKGGSDSMGSSADGGIIGHGGNGGLPGKRVGNYNTTVRTGYFFGGRVNFKNGGLASIL
mgnify:FL=1